jgi:uncharacterized membrane protein YeaQ/YmgE (transglycosylase-associated protein family)
MNLRSLLVSLFVSAIAVSAAPELEKRQLGADVSSAINKATSVIGSVAGDIAAAIPTITSVAGSVFNEATGKIGPIAQGVFSTVVSIGGEAYTVVTSVGGDAVTLAHEGQGRVVSTLGALYTIATSIPTSNAAPQGALLPQYPVQLGLGLLVMFCSTVFGAFLVL